MKLSEKMAKTFAKDIVDTLARGSYYERFWTLIEDEINFELEKSHAYLVFRDGQPYVEFWLGGECNYQAYAPFGVDPVTAPMERTDDDDPTVEMAQKFRTEAENIEAFIRVLRARKVECEAAAVMIDRRLGVP